MSTHINDLASAAVVAAGLNPTTLSSSANGSSVDLGNGDGPCFAIQHVGDLDDEGTLDGKIQESADGSSWSDISGATFTQVAAANNLQVIRFTRTKRYLRWAGTIGGTPLFTVAVAIGSLKKTF